MSRPRPSTIYRRALRLRCPRCGSGALFDSPRHWFRMHERCADCGLKYEREPGYFLGAAYINYGWTSMLLIVLYLSLHLGAGLDNRVLTVPLVAVFVLLPLAAFRHSRSMWLAMDYVIDRTEREDEKGVGPREKP